MPTELYGPVAGAAGGAQTVQTQNLFNLTLSGNTAGVMAQVSSGTLTLVGGTNITLSQAGNVVTIVGASGAGFTDGVSTQGNTLGTTGTVSNGVVWVGGTNITLSQSSAAGGATISILGQSGTQPPKATAAPKNIANIASTGTITRYAPEDHQHIGLAGVNASGTASTFVGNLMLSGTNLTLVTGGNSSAGSIGFSVAAPYTPPLVSKFYWGLEQGFTSSQQSNNAFSMQVVEIPYDISFSRVDVPIFVSLGTAGTTATADLNISSGLFIYTISGSSTLNPVTGSMGSTTYTWASNTSNFSNLTGAKLASFGISASLPAGHYVIGFQMSTTNNSSIGLSTTLLGNTISIVLGSVYTASNYADIGVASNVSSDILMGRGFNNGGTITATNQTININALSAGGAAKQQANFPVLFRNIP